MRVILHDLGAELQEAVAAKGDVVWVADGRYAACQGCFSCWTRHPAECRMRDRLHRISRLLGQAEELVILTRNLYGGYSTPVKNVLDRAIGTSTPLSTYRGGQMHHTLRYGPHDLWRVLVYGDISEAEKATFRTLAARNAVNDGYRRSEVAFFADPGEAVAAL